MDPITALAFANAAIAGLRSVLPVIKDAFARGEITAEQQGKLMAEYNSLKEKADGQFSGKEWEKSGR